jgi:hypothetical protein
VSKNLEKNSLAGSPNLVDHAKLNHILHHLDMVLVTPLKLAEQTFIYIQCNNTKPKGESAGFDPETSSHTKHFNISSLTNRSRTLHCNQCPKQFLNVASI